MTWVLPQSTAKQSDYFGSVSNKDRIFLVHTLRCNYCCSHCLFASGPARREKMGLFQAKRLIGAAADVGYRLFYLTGGEVSLYFEELLQLIAAVSSVGCHSVVETNGSWATSDQIAREKLRSLVDVGLSCVAVSVDTYHLPFGCMEHSLRIAELAKEFSLLCRVLVVASGSDEDYSILRTLDSHGIPYLSEALMTLGRGRDVAALPEILQQGRCDSIGATVLPNGDLISCPGGFDGQKVVKGLPLYRGNVFEEDALALLRAEREDMLSRVIDERGLHYLYSLIPADLRRFLPRRDPTASICDYCRDVLLQEEISNAIRSRITDTRNSTSIG